MVAGAAQLEHLTPEVYRRLHELGDRLRAALADLFETARAPLQVTGLGQLFCYHVNPRPVASYEAAAQEDLATALRINAILTREGIHQVTTSRGSVSTPMGAGELLAYVEAMATAIGELGLAGKARARA
jgi:glutamate-1-semialdehyde aminotransferase